MTASPPRDTNGERTGGQTRIPPERRASTAALAGVFGAGLLLAALFAAGPAGAASADGASIDYKGSNLTLEAAPGQTITGDTGFEAGTRVELRLRSTGGTAFLRVSEATVDEDGGFETTVDLSGVAADTTFNATVVRDGETYAPTRGAVVPCERNCSAADDAAPENSFRDDGGNLTLANATRQTVTGHADLAPGSTVNVRLQSTDARNPFLRTAPATVQQNGTFTAVFDVSDVEGGTAVRALAHHDGEELAETSGWVVACERDCADSVPDYVGEDEERPTQTESWNRTGVAVRPVTTVTQGNSTRLPLSLEGVDSAVLTIGSEEVAYELTARVRDADGDGGAVLAFDTTRAGRNGTALTPASGGDELNVTEESELPGAIDAGSYPVRLAYANGTHADTGTLEIVDDGETDERYDRNDSWAGETFGFRESVTTGRGERVALDVGFGDAETATLSFAGHGYAANLTVRDGDNDGVAAVVVHTDPVNSGGPMFTAADPADSVEILSNAGDGSPDPGTYDLALRRGVGTGGAPDDIATLSLQSTAGKNETASESASPPARHSDRGALGAAAGGAAALAAGALLAIGGIGLILGGYRR